MKRVRYLQFEFYDDGRYTLSHVALNDVEKVKVIDMMPMGCTIGHVKVSEINRAIKRNPSIGVEGDRE